MTEFAKTKAGVDASEKKTLGEGLFRKCDACGDCETRCTVDAIELKEIEGQAGAKAVVDEKKCLGCGACVVSCPIEGGITMEEIRPAGFIPDEMFGPSSILHT